MTRSSRSGFTLIEIMIVVGIIAILVVVLVSSVLLARKKGDEGKADNFVKKVIPAAITKWRDENGKSDNTFPDSPNLKDGDGYWQGTAELYDELVTKPKAKGKDPYVSDDDYLPGDEGGKPTFLDPWGNYYIYRNYSAKRTITGRNKTYTGRKYNADTYDIISKGADGRLYENEKGENDDVYNGGGE